MQNLCPLIAIITTGRASAMRALSAPTFPSIGRLVPGWCFSRHQPATRLLRRPSTAYTSTLYTSAFDPVMTDCQQQQQQQCSGLQHAAVPDRQQPHPQQQQAPSDASDTTDPRCWTKQMTASYMAYGRNWAAVEHFYMQLVSGQQCLSVIGLSPPGSAAGSNGDQQGQQQQEEELQQQKGLESSAQKAQKSAPDRVTYKLRVSYLGGSFSGWLRGNTNVKPTVQDSLGHAIAATGLCEKVVVSKTAKRAAARAERRAAKKQAAAAAAGGVGIVAAAAAAGGMEQEVAAAAAAEPPAAAAEAGGSTAPAAAADAVGPAAASVGQAQAVQQQPQMPFLLCGGRTDAGVSAVGQVASFYSWKPVLSGSELVTLINTQLQQQWTAAAAAAGTAGSITINLQPRTAVAQDQQGVPTVEQPQGSTSVSMQQLQQQEQQQQQGQQQLRLPPACPVRVWQADQVSRQFHPTFAATWRRYLYLMPLRTHNTLGGRQQQQQLLPHYTNEVQHPGDLTPEQQHAVQSAPDVDPGIVHTMLQHLQGKQLNYHSYARDTPKGKDCVCSLQIARASLVWLPQHLSTAQHDAQHHQQQQGADALGTGAEPAVGSSEAAETGQPCLAVELVADRFLRKMVRVLVGTVVREAVAVKQRAQEGAAGGPDSYEQLLRLAECMDRRVTGSPAPGLGLCFADVGYDDAVAM